VFGLSCVAGGSGALAATLEDAWQPSGLPRLWNAELAIRPFGTDRLELAVGAGHADDDDLERIVLRARFWVKLVDGLRLYSEGERVPAMNALALEGNADSRVGVGPAMDFGQVRRALGLHGTLTARG